MKITMRAVTLVAVVLLAFGLNAGIAHVRPSGSTTVALDELEIGPITVCSIIYFFDVEIFCVPD